MGEPRLQDIDDYKILENEKRRVVIAVILSGLVMGTIYTLASSVYDGPADTIKVKKTFKHVPME